MTDQIKLLETYMRESETTRSLMPDPVGAKGWVYRKLEPMHIQTWEALIPLLGPQVKFSVSLEGIVSSGYMTTTEIWMGPTAYENWQTYLNRKN